MTFRKDPPVYMGGEKVSRGTLLRTGRERRGLQPAHAHLPLTALLCVLTGVSLLPPQVNTPAVEYGLKRATPQSVGAIVTELAKAVGAR
jgi:hypothetical protein